MTELSPYHLELRNELIDWELFRQGLEAFERIIGIPEGKALEALSVMSTPEQREAFDQVDAIAAWVRSCVDDGPTLVHCQAGLNRSSLIAGRVLTMAGMTGGDAVSTLRAKRSPACLCNPSFERWLRAAA